MLVPKRKNEFEKQLEPNAQKADMLALSQNLQAAL
jgi:hypothetical protein